MPSEPLPWVTVRRNANGKDRYYWQRRGHKLVRLPDDPVDRLARVTELNQSFNDRTVFVRYGSNHGSQGTDRRDLEWIRP